jgi:hypothetical protein|tara:strand:- start:205 stop:747 length:543 start_codon:yes stop_codon:yes gene_type:complete
MANDCYGKSFTGGGGDTGCAEVQLDSGAYLADFWGYPSSEQSSFANEGVCESLATQLYDATCEPDTGFSNSFVHNKPSKMKKLKATQFYGFNQELLNPKAVAPTQLGASGVSNMSGFSADYSRPSSNKPVSGAGVSSMKAPKAAEMIRPETYSLYAKAGYASKGEGLYAKSDPRNLDLFK